MNNERVFVSGMGIVSSNAVDIKSFRGSLKEGIQVVSENSLPKGNTCALYSVTSDDFIKRIDEYCGPTQQALIRKLLSRRSLSEKATMVATLEACKSAGLLTDDNHTRVNPHISLIVAGNNFQSNFDFETISSYIKDDAYISPTYSIRRYDASLIGLLSEAVNIHGEGVLVGATSASGNVALIEGMRKIKHGYCDMCIVVGAMSVLSPIDLLAFNNAGALAGYNSKTDTSSVNRPFDRDRKGFVPGEAAACVVLESESSALGRNLSPNISLRGGAMRLDANARANPSVLGELGAMSDALENAGVQVEELSYINTHGTGSVLGDETEVEAITQLLGNLSSSVFLNSTKSLVGHCLSSAGLVEVIASAIQMNDCYVHAHPNLVNPITNKLRFTLQNNEPLESKYCLSNGYAFGGINSSIVLENLSV